MKSKTLLSSFILFAVLHPVLSMAPGQKSGEQGQPVEGASLIVMGRVSANFALVRPDKLAGNGLRTLPNGEKTVELPNPSEYYAGTVYQFRVDEVLKRNKVPRPSQTITVLVPGPIASDRVYLSPTSRYLLQLSPLSDAEKYKGMEVMDLNHPAAAKQQFDPRTTFVIINDLHGAVPVTAQNKDLIDSIVR